MSHGALPLARRSLLEAQKTFLRLCVGFLDALDALQTRLRLPSALVKDLKRRLGKSLDRASRPPDAKRLGLAIAESDVWRDVATPDEVRGVVHWLVAVMKWLNELAVATAVGACRRVFILVARFPGVPTCCALVARLFDVVERALCLGADATSAAATPAKKKRAALKHHYMDDSSLTAVVLEYREKECMVPVNINRRIQQFMHFQIPLRSFEATVRLPPAHEGRRRSPSRRTHAQAASSADLDDGDSSSALVSSYSSSSSSSSSSGPSSSSPRSIPASPRARRKFELIYENYFDDVLYQARDKLRLQRAVNLTGEKNRQIPRFNKYECDQEVHLTCGRNCAVKEGPGMYRSVRGTVPILRNRYVYFEIELSSRSSPALATGVVGTLGQQRKDLGSGNNDISACIGIAPRSMLLNTLVGTARHSVGFYSAGHVLVGGQPRIFKAVKLGYGCPATVGVLVRIEEEDHRNGFGEGAETAVGIARADVQFSVNGQPVTDSSGDILVSSFFFPAKVELYPTVSLHTQGVRAYAQFSSPDIGAFDPSCFLLAPDKLDEVVCLDGFQVPSNQTRL